MLLQNEYDLHTWDHFERGNAHNVQPNIFGYTSWAFSPQKEILCQYFFCRVTFCRLHFSVVVCVIFILVVQPAETYTRQQVRLRLKESKAGVNGK